MVQLVWTLIRVHFGLQAEAGPSVGPGLGGRFSGGYDPSATLDPAGFYFQVAAGAVPLIGANYSSEAPLHWKNGHFSTDLPPGKFTWAFGAYIGAADSVVYKTPAFYFDGNSNFNQVSSLSNECYNITDLSKAVVSYANSPNSNTKDPSFAAALKAINTYNANLISQPMSVSTPITSNNKKS